MIMSKALATYFATVNDIPDTEFKVEILEDGPIKKVSVNGTVYDVDYNLGGDTIHSIIMNHKSHGVQISSVGDSTYEVKNKGDYFQDGRPSGHTGPDAGRDPEGICQGRR